MSTDMILNEVLANHFASIAEEMANVVLRSAHTTFVKETQDYAAALVTTEGEVFAYPRLSGVSALLGSPMAGPINAVEGWRPGDVVIMNDPYSTLSAATHLPDLHIMVPVFVDEELVCFAWSFVHSSDVGGSVPGSQDPSNREIFQEGIRIRPTKLFEDGRLNTAVWNLISDNCRIPDKNWGDITAQLSALRRGADRMRKVVDRYGLDPVRHAIGAVLDHTEARTRLALQRIPAGTYHFVDYLEDDAYSASPIRLQVAVTADERGQVTLDFHGSDPQVNGAFNVPMCDNRHHPFLSFALTSFVATLSEGLHLNAGILRCVDLVLPAYSVVNASFPAACAQRMVTCVRVHDAILGALAQAAGVEVPAAGCGSVSITLLAVTREDGSTDVAVANPVQGGAGAGPWADGDAGYDYPTAFLRSVPIEVLETEMPVLVHRFAQLPDSEGAGRYRGGFGVTYEFETTTALSSVVMRGKERYKFSPWGVRGGLAGTNGRTWVRSAEGAIDEIGKVKVYRPTPGEAICLEGPGGGGYGSPLERDPEAVRRDVLDGLVSVERAREVYGVALRDGGDLGVDADDTRELRGERPAASDRAEPDLGPRRRAWEAQFGEAMEQLSGWLSTDVPAHLRSRARELAFDELATVAGAQPATPFVSDTLRRVQEKLSPPTARAGASTLHPDGGGTA